MDDWQFLRHKRIVFIFALFILAFFLLGIQLGTIQVLDRGNLRTKAVNQHRKAVSLEVLAPGKLQPLHRGNFYDRKGRSLLDSKMEDRVIVFPQFNQDLTETSFVLGKILGDLTLNIRNKLNDGPAILPYSISAQQKKAIEAAQLEGVVIAPTYTRYGSKPLATNLIGHLKDGFKTGAKGLEAKFEPYLKSTESELSVVAHVNARGELIPGLGYERIRQQDVERRHVVLTIDQRIQQVVEDIMDSTMEEGAVMVMDTTTGDILASATRPTFDPVNLPSKDYNEKGEEINVYRDRTMEFSSPGSVFKILVTIAALEEGIADTDTVFYCDQPPIYFKECQHGKLTLAEALAISCNNTFAKLGLKLGKETLLKYATKVNLDNQNVIGYGSFKGSGFIEKIQQESHTLVNASIGQGKVELSPLQVTAMVNSIANGGVYRRPRLVERIIDSSGKSYKTYGVSTGEQVISFETAEKVHKMLREVTLYGTAVDAYIEGYGTAGKTGTAQIYFQREGKVDLTTHSWFSGYSPVHRPTYVITVLMEKGKNEEVKATKVFQEIMERILEIEVK